MVHLPQRKKYVSKENKKQNPAFPAGLTEAAFWEP